MSWTKHFTVIKSGPVMPQVDRSTAYSSTTARTSSWLNIAYQGNPQRIPRYYQFQEMDSDSDINTALDTIADFCTQSEEQSDEPFEVKFNGEPNDSEVKIIKQMLARWIKLNSLRSRLWYMFRDTIKNGDAFFLRDPETQEWLWLDHFMVELVKVDETKGKVPDEYIIRGLDYNRQTKFGSKQADPNAYRTPFGTSTVGGARPMGSGSSSSPASFSMVGTDGDQRQRGMQGPFSQELSVVDAQFVVHLSLSIGNDINWPFGPSILEPIFKTFKQKELLEDAIIIYRVQRAPERRIFYIDVGTMPPERAKRHIEAIKNDIHQRRIPNRTGTGGSIMDAAYNPLCMDFATRIPLLDGRTLALSEIIEEFEGGKTNWVYSCDPISGQFVPAPISWAGSTRKNAEVIKITLDNGACLTVTPDHKIPILGKGEVKAKDLTPDDSLVAFHVRQRKTSNAFDDRTYTQLFDHVTKKWKYVHRTVAKFFRARGQDQESTFLSAYTHSAKNTIHHADDNFSNNDPANLVYMNAQDHIAFHAAERELDAAGQRLRTYCKIVRKEPFISSRNMLAILADTVREYRFDRVQIAELLNENKRFLEEVHKVNPLNDGWKINPHLTEVTPSCLDKIIADFGYKNWKDFSNKANFYNHRIASIEPAGHMNVGTITVDKAETYSPYHTFAIEAGIFIYNSINDDYFFASSSEGRGSKVETLPGGDGNNEILDLTFFSKKLARGLRVPTSYLNIGDDASNSVTFNDGKLGAAMIQEYRFSKYCMRLQSLLAPKFDHEFKRYLGKNGIEIEASLFELQFNPPQSFTRYRQIELDTQRVAVYQGVAENKKLAERFKLKRFLGLSEDEIIENEELWSEENADKLKKKTGASPAEGGAGEGLSAVGIHPEGGDMGMGAEMPEGDMPEGTDPEGGAGGAGAAPGGAPPAAGAPPGGAASAGG